MGYTRVVAAYSRAVLAALVLASCSFNPPGLSGDDPEPTGDAGLVTADAGAIAADASAPDAMPPAPLVDTGLVVRYFMDEAASGTEPQSLIDSSGVAPQLNLPIIYGQASYIDDGNRGLAWGTAGGNGKVEIGLGSAKLDSRLRRAQRLTIEIVVDIDGSGNAGAASELTGMRGGFPDFMLTAVNNGEIRFLKPFGTLGSTWPGVDTGERMVLHMVWNTTLSTGADRIRLYKNGVIQGKSEDDPPAQGSTVGLVASDDLIIGNSRAQNRSIAGTIYYVAYYDEPLSDGDIVNNAQRLLASDDQ